MACGAENWRGARTHQRERGRATNPCRVVGRWVDRVPFARVVVERRRRSQGIKRGGGRHLGCAAWHCGTARQQQQRETPRSREIKGHELDTQRNPGADCRWSAVRASGTQKETPSGVGGVRVEVQQLLRWRVGGDLYFTWKVHVQRRTHWWRQKAGFPGVAQFNSTERRQKLVLSGRGRRIKERFYRRECVVGGVRAGMCLSDVLWGFEVFRRWRTAVRSNLQVVDVGWPQNRSDNRSTQVFSPCRIRTDGWKQRNNSTPRKGSAEASFYSGTAAPAGGCSTTWPGTPSCRSCGECCSFCGCSPVLLWLLFGCAACGAPLD